MFSSTIPLSFQTGTRSASAAFASFHAFANVSVGFRESVAVLAMCFAWHTTSVFGDCDGFQMIGVNTERVSAQMVDRQPIGDWAGNQFVRKSMSLHGLGRALRDAEMAVPATHSTSPEPAVISLVDVSPEAYVEWNKTRCGQWVTMADPSLVVHPAPATTYTTRITTVNIAVVDAIIHEPIVMHTPTKVNT